MRKIIKSIISRKNLRLLLLIAAAFLIFYTVKYIIKKESAACIGVILPITGDDKDIGETLLKALELFRKETNAKMKLGKEIRFIIRDEYEDPVKARQEAEKMVNNKKVVGVIGYFYSKNLEKVADIYEKGCLPLVTLSASEKIVAGNNWIFSMVGRDTEQGFMMAVYLKEIMKKNNVTLINEKNIYGEGLLGAFEKKALRIGLKINKNISLDMTSDSISDIIVRNFSNLENLKTEAVALFTTNKKNAIEIIKLLRKNNFEGPIFVPGSFHAGRTANELGFQEEDALMKNVFVTSHFVSELANSKVVQLFDSLIQKYGIVPYRDTPFCYAAAELFSHAIQNGAYTRNEIKRYFDSIKYEHPLNLITGFSYFDKDGFKNNDVYVLMAIDGWLKPTFIQLKKQREPLPGANNVITVDGTNYFVVDIVYVGLDFFRINDINTKDMNFDMELFLWYKWMGKDIDISEIEIVNGIFGITDKTTLIQKDMSKPVKYACYRVKGTFLKPFDLSEFPFDSQSLPIIIAHRTKDWNKLMLVMDKKHKQLAIEHIYPREWQYLGRKDVSQICEYNSSFGVPDYRKDNEGGNYFSAIEANILLKRLPVNYVLTIFVPLFIIIAIAIILFFVPIDRFDTRLSTAMTALLSLVVFQMSTRNPLPHVGYLLKSDISFFIGYILIFTTIINIVILHVIFRNSEKRARIVNIIFCLIFVVFTLVTYSLLTFF
ncbi:MAG: hypothetical protein A2017_02485 [Lentisphaerae bacterium GWF2_44_16]|nr:MAG: hypothetical protein A2017_02485 [Lentisphaerae bacterium GWF2_44_16]